MTYSTQEAARLTGLSLRQLQLMDDQHVVCPQRKPGPIPSIHPRDRFYSPRDIQSLHLVARLHGLGLRTREIREVMFESEHPINLGSKWVAIYKGTSVGPAGKIPRFFSDAKALIRYGVRAPGGILTVELPR